MKGWTCGRGTRIMMTRAARDEVRVVWRRWWPCLLVMVARCPCIVAAGDGGEGGSLCDGSGCCQQSNNAFGPLNLTVPRNGFDAKLEQEKTFIYHCIRYFTRLHWFHMVNGEYIPFPPSGQDQHARFLDGRQDNQTILIERVMVEDAGEYMYIASNGTHEVNGTFTLKVDCRDVGPSFANSELPVQPIGLGRATTLSCIANPPHCPSSIIFPPSVYWTWVNGTSYVNLLRNGTLEGTSVICNSAHQYYGRNCTVLIETMRSELYHGLFSCRFVAGDSSLNMTVRLTPEVMKDMCAWPCLVSVGVSAAVLSVVVVVVYWRYGHRLHFWLRSPPSKGSVTYDAAILNGEDFQDLVREVIRPGLAKRGHDLLPEATLGTSEFHEMLAGVNNSYGAVLVYSALELQEDGHIDFLTKYVIKRRSRGTVVLVRCQDSCTAFGTDSSGPDEDGRTPATNTTTRTSENRNIWKSKELRDVKVVDFPIGLLQTDRSEALSIRERRNIEKFWFQLRRVMPKVTKKEEQPQPASNRTPSGTTRTSTRNTSTTESQRPLMGSFSENGCRHESVTSTTVPVHPRPETLTEDLEDSRFPEGDEGDAGKTEEEEGLLVSSSSSPQNQHQPDTNGPGRTSEVPPKGRSSCDEDVFVDNSTITNAAESRDGQQPSQQNLNGISHSLAH